VTDEDRLLILAFWTAMRFGVGISAGLRSDNLSPNEILTAVGWGDARYGEEGWLGRFARGVSARQLLLAGLLS
jgi:hypothetical protein